MKTVFRGIGWADDPLLTDLENEIAQEMLGSLVRDQEYFLTRLGYQPPKCEHQIPIRDCDEQMCRDYLVVYEVLES